MNGTQYADDNLQEMVPIGAVLSDAVLAPVTGSLLGAPTTPEQSDVLPTCPHCDDAGYYTERVQFGHPHFGVLFPCSCKLTEWDDRRRQDMLHLSNLDPFHDMTFQSFEPKVKGVRRAFLQAHEFAQELQGWLSLFGGYGVGKTHLAAAIANEALKRNIGVIFAIVPDLLDHLRATFAPTSAVTYDQRFELIRNVPLLILDDLGTESATPWAREKLYQIVNHRYNQGYPTVFTSNQPVDQIDGRIFSRMCDPRLNATIVHIEAEDYRRRHMKGVKQGP